MINNYLNFCLKSIKQKQSNSFFVVAGTALTAATVVLLFALLLSKKNPNNVLKDTDRIIVVEETLRTRDGNNWTDGVNFRLIKEHFETIDEVSHATIYRTSRIQHWIRQERIESRLMYADHRLIDFFDLKFIEGSYFSEEDYNAEAKVIAISERSSKLFFGNESALGKTVKNQHGSFKVIGVYRDVAEIRYLDLSRSFDEIIPLTHDDIKDRLTSIDQGSYTYVSLLKANSLANVENVKQAVRDNSKKFEVRPENMTLYMVPFVADEFLYTKIKMPTKTYLINQSSYQFYVSSLLLIIVLTIICLVNISNLTMTTMLNRNVEFGVRYAFGANRFDIIKQGFIESLLFSFFSILLSLAITFTYFYLLNTINYSKNLNYEINLTLVLVLVLYSFLIPLISYVMAIYRINDRMPVSLLKGNL